MTESSASERRFMPQVSDDLPVGERPMIAVVRSLPGHERELESAVTTLAAAVRREPGCREFRLFRDLSEPGTLYLCEIYDDADAFRNHLRTPHVTEFFTQLSSHSTSDATALTQLEEI